MNTTRLLERIRYHGPLDVSLETLGRLQQAFLFAVPFENLDIESGRHITFKTESVYRKVVEEGRGGFCYELNSLFHDLLNELGFNVNLLAATMMRDGRPGTVMGHLVLRVAIDGQQWLTDVGNGKSFRQPLALNGTNEDWAEGVGYRTGECSLGPCVLETDPQREWHPRFLFDPKPKQREDFLAVCEWTQTSPDSRFTQHRICTLARPNGRRTLIDNKLTIEEDGKIEEREIGEKELVTCLQQQFGIMLPGHRRRA